MTDDTPMKVTAETVIAAFVKLRDARSALKQEFEENDALLKAKMAKLQQWLNKQMSELDTSQLSGSMGTAYRELETRYNAADWPLVWGFIKENDRFDFLQKRLGEKALTDYFNEVGELPPGINVFQEYVIKVRRK